AHRREPASLRTAILSAFCGWRRIHNAIHLVQRRRGPSLIRLTTILFPIRTTYQRASPMKCIERCRTAHTSPSLFDPQCVETRANLLEVSGVLQAGRIGALELLINR